MFTVKVIFVTIYFVLPIILCFSNSVAAKEKLEELCFWESFKPKCSSNEVVFVEDAKYGMMRIGKCLAQSAAIAFGSQGMDNKGFGCFHDVTAFVSRNCSLERQCELKVGILERLKYTECWPEVKMYLEVKYSCLPVIDHQTTGCHVFLTGTSKYLAITPTNNIVCGTVANPLMVEVSNGQRIGLTVIPMKIIETTEGRECQRQIGTIIDRKSQFNATLCDNGIYNPSIHSHVTNGYISKVNRVSLVFNRIERNYKVLLGMKAEGCLDIIPPDGKWMKRTNDDLVIGCYSSNQIWYLRCDDGQWTGSIGICSNPDTFILESGHITPSDKAGVTDEKQNVSPMHLSITFVIIAIVAVEAIVCLALVVCLAVIYLKRMAYKRKQRGNGFPDQSLVPSTLNKQTLPSMPENVDLDGDERYQVVDKDEVANEIVASK